MDDLKSLGKRVRNARLSARLGIRAAAKEIGIAPDTYRKVEEGRNVHDVNRAKVLAYFDLTAEGASRVGSEEVDEPPPASVIGVETMEALYGRIAEVQAEFERAIASLAKAEADFDSMTRYWATTELMKESMDLLLEARQKELGRALSAAERLELAAQVPRPTKAAVARLTASLAADDSREWTRYEMALLEEVLNYPQDARIGSGYADLEPFRERVRRLGFDRASSPRLAWDWPDDGNDGAAQGVTLTPEPDRALAEPQNPPPDE